MALDVQAEEAPLYTDPDGVARISQTRVTLDTVVGAFRDGATPEEITQQYPTLQLGEVYAVIAYYLRHHIAVDAYLGERAALAAKVRLENEVRFDPHGVRARLLSRRVGRKV